MPVTRPVLLTVTRGSLLDHVIAAPKNRLPSWSLTVAWSCAVPFCVPIANRPGETLSVVGLSTTTVLDCSTSKYTLTGGLYPRVQRSVVTSPTEAALGCGGVLTRTPRTKATLAGQARTAPTHHVTHTKPCT